MHPYLNALIGGALLGIAVVGYLYVNGRIAGISGLIGQLFKKESFFQRSATWFLWGLFVTPFIYGLFFSPEIVIHASPLAMIIAGLLVGFGTRLGSGCTSGHGICGMSRLSKRSMVATSLFMLAGFITVYIMRHLLGL
ncbi:YeeE/YedE family protein [Acinetobacter defluvii]|uniref:YeeE/YedE family protein n=1 Tax=Acinetobacter defluvii TaxID=1871111 RepID=UPI003AF505D4